MKMKNDTGWQRTSQAWLAWYWTTCDRFNTPTCMNTGTTLNPRQTS